MAQIPENKRTHETCLTAIYFEQESYRYADKYKTDDYFNLMAYLVNPSIESKLDERACAFITDHPYIKVLSDFFDGSEPKKNPTKKEVTIVDDYYDCYY